METLTLPAKLESLAQIGAFVEAAALDAGLDAHAAWQVQLAVDEAATNIIQYAYDPEQNGQVVVEHETQGDAFVVRLRDNGRVFDPDLVPPPDLASPIDERQVGGLGLYLIRQLVDDVRFETEAAGNVATLVKQKAPPSPPVFVYAPAGRLDAAATPGLVHLVLEQARPYAWRVVVDLSQVSFISSSGLRSLLLLLKELRQHGGDLRLCALQPRVAAVFDMTGFAQVFAIDGTVAEALRAFAVGRR
jgi:anti-anti-sigma factor